MRKYWILVCCSVLLCEISLTSCNKPDEDGSIPSLHEEYSDYFPIGAAIAPKQLHNEDEPLINKHICLMTPEDQMKAELLHPSENFYNWAPADELLTYAESNNMSFHGHCLIWHLRTADWMFVDNGQPASRELLIQRMKDHIYTVVGRYKGRIKYWDVVNEAISDKTTEFYKEESIWYKMLGEEYIELAFQFAHEADPNAILIYNDYGLCMPSKRAKVFQLVSSLKEKGVPVHAVGEQGHWNLDWPTINEIGNTIDLFSGLEIQFHITELDIDIYGNPNLPEIALPSEDIENQLEIRYREIFSLFRTYKDKISTITFWGIADNYTWLDNHPVLGRKNAPLLFDVNREPKKCFWAVVNF